MKKEPPINLAKCKIGQRVRLRNGEIATLKSINTANSLYPFIAASALGKEAGYTKEGFYYYGKSPRTPLDIVAILPLPKKKAKTATHMGRKVDISENRGIDIGPAKRAIIRQAIELLTLLLKQ